MSPPNPRYAAMLATTLLAAATGCDELDKNGRLDNGEFQYECVGPGDGACHGSDAIFGFDLDRQVLPIATGGSFKLSFDSDLTEDGAEEIVAASGQIVTREGDGFAFREGGTVDFLAKNGDHEVVDFVDFTGVEPEALAIFANGSPRSTIEMESYETLVVAAAPVSGSQVLGGGFSYTWSASGGGGLSVSQAPSSVSDTGSNVAELRGSGDGTSQLTASNGASSVTITVIIGTGVTTTTTTTSSGSGGSGGAGGAGGGSGGAGGSGGGSGGAGGAAGAGGAGGG